ncbi:MAG: hypothetical protein KME20_03670 [Kaiparowitsia implicata GSE-PSE-MK54-09C]|nr:hypothetical protein [Kaiparowitsia implicata GSE-PSE-MK54-09C]
MQATQDGAARASRILTDRAWSRNDLAERVSVTPQTINKFFNSQPVNRRTFVEVCRVLELDWEQISGTSTLSTSISTETPEVLSIDKKNEYYNAIKLAHQRIWVYQTWLPTLEIEAQSISSNEVLDTRLLLLSFKETSPIYARLIGRYIEVEDAKAFSSASVKLLVRSGKENCIRFNYGHHPGWIAVLDSFVFSGPTPVNKDSHNVDYLFDKYHVDTKRGEFWEKQFEYIWNKCSHSFDEEKTYNSRLSRLNQTTEQEDLDP